MTEGPLESTGEAPERETGSRNQVARLQQELRKSEARAERAERALDRTQRSASYVVGNLLVKAAKNPRKLLTLPRDLWRIWRLRGSRRTTSTSGAPARTRRDEILDLDAPRLLIPRTSVAPAAQRSLAIAGALSHRTARAWWPYAAVSSALPHEGPALIEAVDADIVVIDTSAALPGESWSHLGDPSAVDRMRAAAALVDAAHAQGRPVVLLRTTPPSHTVFLSELAARCDLVVDGPGSLRENPWHPGIDPAAWQSPRPRTPGVLIDWASEAGTPVERQLRNAILAAVEGTAIHTPDPRLHRRLALNKSLAASTFGITDPVWVERERVGAGELALGLLASGRRVVGGRDADLALLLAGQPQARGAAVLVDSADELPAAVAAAQQPMSDAQRRAVLRAIVLEASAPVQLQTLVDLLAVESRPRAVWDVAMVTSRDDDLDKVLLQSWLPRELVVASTPPERLRASLDEAGVMVTALPDDVRRNRTLLDMAVTTPFIATQVDLDDPVALLDLLVEHIAGLPPLPRSNDSALWSVS